jgi:hypothetical protein
MENEPENRDWVQWLSEKLEFPFEVERVDDNDEYVLFGNPTENEHKNNQPIDEFLNWYSEYNG